VFSIRALLPPARLLHEGAARSTLTRRARAKFVTISIAHI
jgi:hypothetical protein